MEDKEIKNEEIKAEPDYSGEEYKSWRAQRKVIPVMIEMYCHGNHKTHKKEICEECKALTDYAILRLDKCPFKKNKKFCGNCTIHCYQPPYREQIKAVMRYSGPRIFFRHPVFATSHMIQTIKFKREQKKN